MLAMQVSKYQDKILIKHTIGSFCYLLAVVLVVWRVDQ